MEVYDTNKRNTLYFELIQSLIFYIKHDLSEMCEKLETASFPIITTIFTNIDFFGGLLKGFKKTNSKTRSIEFITKFMGSNLSPIYKSKDFAKYLVENLRNKLVHEACIYGNFETSKSKDMEEYHLSLIKYREDVEFLFIHPNLLKDDFFRGINVFTSLLEKEAQIKENVLNNFISAYEINLLYNSKLPYAAKNIIQEITKLYCLPEITQYSYPAGTSFMTSVDRKNDEVIKFIINTYLSKINKTI